MKKRTSRGRTRHHQNHHKDQRRTHLTPALQMLVRAARVAARQRADDVPGLGLRGRARELPLLKLRTRGGGTQIALKIVVIRTTSWRVLALALPVRATSPAGGPDVSLARSYPGTERSAGTPTLDVAPSQPGWYENLIELRFALASPDASLSAGAWRGRTPRAR